MATLIPVLRALRSHERLRLSVSNHRRILSSAVFRRAYLSMAADALTRFYEIRQRERAILNRLLNGSDDEARQRAADDLARITWNRALRRPRGLRPQPAWRAFKQWARDVGEPAEELLCAMFSCGLVQASKEAGTEQHVRLGKDWLNGRRRKLRPCTLPPGQLVQWLRRKAYSHVEGLVKGLRDDVVRPYEEPWLDSVESARRTREIEETLVAGLDALETKGAAERLTSLLHTTQEQKSPKKWSRRERQVMALVERNLTSAEIADKLGISPETVRVLKRRALRKLPPV